MTLRQDLQSEYNFRAILGKGEDNSKQPSVTTYREKL